MEKGSAIIWVIVVAVLAVGGAVAAYVATDGFGTQDVDNEQAIQTDETAPPKEPKDDVSLLRSALDGNASITCDFTHEDGSSGMAYFKANRDFSVEQKSAEGDFRLIKLDDTVYIWDQNQKQQGFKADAGMFEEEMAEGYSIFSPEKFEREVETETSIDCERTNNLDDELFTIPDDVNFAPASDLVEQNQ